jgi:hypothetical protein
MVRVSKEYEDFDPDDPDLYYRKNRQDYWLTLRKIREEFMETQAEFDVFAFDAYIKNSYGVSMVIVEGQITDKFKIVDEQKHLLFLLKWK